jgi:hypothetical protein
LFNEGKPEEKTPIEPVVERAEPAGDAVDALKSQFDDLRKTAAQREADLNRERMRASSAEQDAQRARAEAAAARTEVTDSRLNVIEQGLASAQTAAEAAEAEYISAQEAGDWKRAAAAQRKLARAEAESVEYSRAKVELETAKTEQPQRQAPAEHAPDPIEQFISGPLDERGTRRAPNVQTWLRAHQEYITDPKKLMKLDGAHRLAVSEDLTPQSDEYIARVEEILGMKKAADDPAPKPQPNGQQQPRRRSVPAAPVNGGSSAGSAGAGQIEVRLTQGQSKAATDGTHVWLESDLKSGRIKDKSLIGEPIGEREMARRVYLMDKERPGIFTNGNIEQ